MERDLAKITPKQKPQVIAVWNDLFHEAVPFEFIEKAFERMAECKQHLFLVLTKRPERALEFCRYLTREDVGYLREENIWFGFTAENQEWFDRRWEYARQIQAAGIFVSYEPALGPLVLPQDFLERGPGAWVVAGGESGPKARPMHPDWARRVRTDCQLSGLPFFFKQWGEVLTIPEVGKLGIKRPITEVMHANSLGGGFLRVGKKAAGRLLDGRTWEEMPHA
jgi:protein gp37